MTGFQISLVIMKQIMKRCFFLPMLLAIIRIGNPDKTTIKLGFF